MKAINQKFCELCHSYRVSPTMLTSAGGIICQIKSRELVNHISIFIHSSRNYFRGNIQYTAVGFLFPKHAIV